VNAAILRGGSASSDSSSAGDGDGFALPHNNKKVDDDDTKKIPSSLTADYIHQTIIGGHTGGEGGGRENNNNNNDETTEPLAPVSDFPAVTVEKPSKPTTPTVKLDKPTKKLLKSQKKEIKKKDKEIKKLHKKISKSLKNRNSTNKRRKFTHFAWGMLFAFLNNYLPLPVFQTIMKSWTALMLFFELTRYREGWEWINEMIFFLFGKAMRKSEMDGKCMGTLYYSAGVLLNTYLYSKPCATLGIIQLAIADPMASYFGRATRHVYWSRINNGFLGGLGRNKGILGFLGGALACVPLNYRIVWVATRQFTIGGVPKIVPNSTVFVISVALGLAGAFADLIVPTPALELPEKIYGVTVPPFHLDDNLIVPVVSGGACIYILQMAGLPVDLALAKYLIV